MSVVIAEDFEAGLGAWTLNGSPTTSAAAKNTGTLGLVIDTTGAAATQFIQRSLAASTRTFVARFYLNVQQRPASGNNLFVCLNASGDCKLVLMDTGVLRAQVGSGTAQNSTALTNATWYRIDVRFLSSGTATTIDWSINGVAQTQASTTQAAADMTFMRFGIQGATTVKLYADTLAVTNVSGDYPLGVTPVSVNAGLASGTATTHVVHDSDLAAGPTAAAGTGAANSATTTLSTKASAGNAAGTGAAAAGKISLSPAGGAPAGTGSVGTPGRTMLAKIAAAAGTGAATSVTPSVASGTRLTITMG